ncbi:MAG: DNA polymerase III subunit chi [Thauera propionica]|jgi:DNA polymerase-3 subunit chi|uniref:DNA polymerase III subunit chi n=1 Tax=Thauera propionica TaxID=2019431 RepID=UPI0023F55359|nr:DNA polymerase III subunit chi [Thauera propionica]MDD3674345.1 DNA polymerase III subunit chi [Thauera propionica]MDY0046680.1 DNA polymerase III subunit chi [Thauera propionica]
MDTRVQFYHNTPDRLALVSELVARAHGKGRKVAVRMPDAASAQQLDRLLWTSEPLAFVPHVMLDSPLAAETPVVLGTAGADADWPHGDTLFNLAPDLPPAYDRFRLVIEIVGQSEAEKVPARARWSAYRQRGLETKAFDAERRVAL